MNPADDPAELFVCGRLCLLGEHSDWAGGFRSAARPDTVHVGRCVVVGTNDGLRARVSTSSGSDMCVAMTSTDDAGAKRSRVFDLYDDEALLRAARGGADAHDDGSGTFWRYVAGTLHHLIVSSPHADAIAAALATKCVAIDNYETTLPMKKGLSSSAAACVLVVRAMSTACGLGLSAEEEMEAAYLGERRVLSPH